MTFKLLVLTILAFFCVEFAYSQKNRKLAPSNKTTEKVDSDVQKQIKLLFEAKEIQPLIDESSTIRLKQFDNVNKANFKDYKIKNKTVVILDSSDLLAQNDPNYFYIVSWNDVLNMLDIELVHQATKTKVKILLTKIGNEWGFGTSELVSDKKVEPQKNTPARKPLRRRNQ